MPKTILVIAAAAVLLALAPAAQPATKTLYGFVGPGHTISLKNAAGGKITSVPAGTYTIIVQDRARDHNFRLVGPGLNRTTSLAGTGRTVWRNVRLVRGKVYRLWCDPHLDNMKSTFRVR